MAKSLVIFFCFCFLAGNLFAQEIITGTVIDQESGEPLPYANVYTKGANNPTLTNIDGTFQLQIQPEITEIIISYVGFQKKVVSIQNRSDILVKLQRIREDLDRVLVTSTEKIATRIINKALANKPQNDPNLKFNSYQYQTYSKLIIDDEERNFNVNVDSTNAEVKTILKRGRSYLSEQVSDYKYTTKEGLKETIEATRTAGFKNPVYELLSTKVQSSSWYDEKYTVFGSDYASPLADHPFRNYTYQVLDTTSTSRPAFVIYFEPKRRKSVAGLEGVLYIDTLNYGIQKAVGQLKGEVDVKATQEFTYYPEENIWFPKEQSITLKPGTGGEKVSIFGGSISLGSLPEKQKNYANRNELYLNSVSIYKDIQFNEKVKIPDTRSAVTLVPEATKRTENYWEEKRALPFTERDRATFKRVDSIIKAENIARRIEVIQNFNIGYYPISFIDIDLRTLVKYNDYEGLRLGMGGITNEKLSERFRLEGYGVYGFKDEKVKYSFGGGLLLNKSTNTWLNVNYTDDINEVGSFFYLTDRRIYSLFEPRLVNINFYYKFQTLRTSLQHRFAPNLLSEFQLAKSDISQTKDYAFRNNNILYSDYSLTEATASFRWSPFSTYLESPDKNIELDVGYPKFSFQATQAFDNFLGGDFEYTKLGLKMNYTINRINQTKTEFLLEGDYAFGDIPLTHSFHAYPNNPNKENLMQRFSVAGRRTFETMYFSEFFSDRLATLQIKHHFRPWDWGKFSNPELVLITRHAIGNFSDQQKHYGLTFNTLDQGYSESGLEINKILFGFGLSFAYRYGAYHLPEIEDNMSLKFTFYFKL
ncbi:DUF5686 and carboxypeptidase-like regulatory domain-containing protein [Mesonia maritima]|uniref:Carboxypeptidase-like regulatory domain-containing protein n=1 Tax=Mesonia maritima TaxID=1793873 RepID=A0ABU1K3C0_9FLAO|nr:DUF5686 family protein [Mesonia maritima]MDR6300112.1 hypothetical protein [Mesonia maritima]